MDLEKKLAAEASIDFIKDGMVVGLGSGSTVNWMVRKLGEKVKQGLNIRGIPSSKKTERLALEVGVPLTDFASVDCIDIAIDGADEIDGNLNLLKGGGGSLVREKVVDVNADQFIVIIDQSKVVEELGELPLPIEVLQFGWEIIAKKIAELGGETVIRIKDEKRFISDNGNYILDCKFGKITKPEELHEKLKLLTGVVETGIFTNMVDKVIIGRKDEVEVLEK
ncbi:ribose 5-phosphate isomerase A [Oceanobacillus arenosus]|uniref:Ribose-5-phosphate isomerase A n=2 Tax=Oceanobacillus arenosus TaxID=1229153 RepID=A0A3D8Q2V4_9BACI|nr:ribose-5-phosphate isomerase RpiA [Oceanobacillus arenosus]RDW22472.1 ribose 5-phosphate isomerase A [Oceanobacillus arenosus]